MEGTRNEFEVAERWSLYVAYTGDLSEFNSKRWQAFIDEVKAAVKGRNYVRSMGRSCTFNEFELPPGLLECIVAEQAAVRESSSSAEVTAEADKFRREQYAWTVDVVMWEGPPRRSSTRR